MNKIITCITLLIATITLVACQPNDKKQEAKKEMKAVEDLKVKLNATEAQLLNVQVELAKCKGDSLAIDSLSQMNFKE